MNAAGCGCAVALGLMMAGLGPQQAAQPRERLIDLTTAPTISSMSAVPESRQLTLQVPVAVSTHANTSSPIRVSPPQLDRSDYWIGEPLFFDVVFENIGATAIEFPTLLDGSGIDRDMAGAALASIALTFDDEVLGLQMVSPQAIYGARDVPGSLVTLQPHDSVRIRVRGRWILSRAMGTPKPGEWPRSLKVKAAVTLVGNRVTRMIDTSRETVPVVLRANP